MRRALITVAGVALVLALAGCTPTQTPTSSSTPTETASNVLPTVDPSLIPTASPKTIQDVAADPFLMTWGDYVFKIGTGPVWCTISPASHLTICEINEVNATYDPIPAPSTCNYSYGYQVELQETKPATGDEAFLPCAGGAYSDASTAPVLADGDRITVGAFSCYVQVDTARCDNTDGSYIALGPKVWALGQGTN